jgi:hypothetical protein
MIAIGGVMSRRTSAFVKRPVGGKIYERSPVTILLTGVVGGGAVIRLIRNTISIRINLSNSSSREAETTTEQGY